MSRKGGLKTTVSTRRGYSCHVYEIDDVEGETFIVMELIEGKKLRKALRGSRH